MLPRIRLCTWNIDRSGVRSRWRSGPQSAWLTLQQADVTVLTEVHGAFEVEGRCAVALSANGQPPYASWEHAVGIWSRYPVIEHIPVGDPSLACCVTLQTPVGPVVVYATILPYRNAGQHDGRSAWEIHRLSVKQQISDWTAIRQARPDDHVVVAGDFNMTMEPSNTYVDRSSRQRLLQACEGLSMRCLTAYDTRSEIGRSNIDHILASRALWLVGAPEFPHPAHKLAGADRLLSDHNAVIVTFEGQATQFVWSSTAVA
ncbi:MAG TPA: endonuclease/exonuclease/phosphatase family protein [Hydrogenophaga sp.]|uniref:endonuclease/exonuclease/phosphatase family protein n=1 Tax=Hydrogenophaga sp. TaxID=1904254 RepID=UPI002C2725B4|nr:endonuclease/exonuclease/phosphatase family protein [Hydrogenophaga sp.]HMN92722.1 endonuclease/exonuclease/phosphatase family protein [Hydrogenophaga sp.]HMP08880.1 endonuclease/exonuclease/phosphatase family protein [Hydrogenophaga sp.]